MIPALLCYGLFIMMAGLSIANPKAIQRQYMRLRVWATDKDTPWPVFILAMAIVGFINWMAY